MDELDERVANGLREVVGRAPVDAEVWVETERHVARHRRRRRTIGAGAAVVAVVAVAVGMSASSTTSKPRVRVATTTPTTTPETAPPTPASTTPVTSPVSVPSVPDCSSDCLGRATADVDGDGRPDKVGLFATPPQSGDITAHTDSTLVVRVVFADGQVSESRDTADWYNEFLGAGDVNGDGKAEIFYFNFTGANNHMGHILDWDGSQLVVVRGTDAKPFETFTSGYALGGDGFRCAGDSFVTTTLHYDGPPTGWNGFETTYRWNSTELVKISEHQPVAITQSAAVMAGELDVPPEYDQLIGVHCPGLGEAAAPNSG